MAGPAIALWLPHWGNDDTAWMTKLTHALARNVAGRDFWIDDGASIGSTYRGEGVRSSGAPNKLLRTVPSMAGEVSEIRRAFCFEPTMTWTAAAMCNADIDHSLLAMLALKVLEARTGVIEFGGLLSHRGPHPGQLVRVAVDGGASLEAHVADAEFLRYWIADPAFRLIK